jgi:hypothetical protein
MILSRRRTLQGSVLYSTFKIQVHFVTNDKRLASNA